jgi:hypothetical protein
MTLYAAAGRAVNANVPDASVVMGGTGVTMDPDS